MHHEEKLNLSRRHNFMWWKRSVVCWNEQDYSLVESSTLKSKGKSTIYWMRFRTKVLLPRLGPKKMCVICFRMWRLKSPVCCFVLFLYSTFVNKGWCLSTESVKGLSLSLEGVDNVHGSDGLTAGVLSVGYTVTDDVLKKYLKDSTSLLVDESWNTLDTTTTGETADSGLSDSLDIITKYLTMTLRSPLT